MSSDFSGKSLVGVGGIVVLWLSSFLIAWPSKGADNNPLPTVASIQQKATDLLAGLQAGICYSGFRHGQHPDRGDGAVNPSDDEILEDLQILSRHDNFHLIRLYDSRANSETVLRLIHEHKLKLKVLLGAWLVAEVSNPNCPWLKQALSPTVLAANKLENAKEIENAIRLAKQYPDLIVAVAVGNEMLVSWNDHMVPVESVIGYVRRVKKSVAQPVTVCDNYDWWSHHGSELATELDFISVHTYPLWEGKGIDQAMSYTVANLQAVRNALPKSRMVVTEAGWATLGKEFGARAGEEQQKRYYQELYAWTGKMNITTFFFEAFDEDWKGEPNELLGAEKHWGLFSVDRHAKKAMSDLYPDPAHGQQLDFGDHSSKSITGKAWEALTAKNYENAVAYAKKCVEMYEKQAIEMQKELKEPVPAGDRDAVSKKWALNDVGTCLFIMGQALEKQDKNAEALVAYRQLSEKVPFAQSWDPQGWFWKPADAAKVRIKALEFDARK